MFEGIRAKVEGAVARAVCASIEGRQIDPVDGIVAGAYLAALSYAAHRFGASPEPRSREAASATKR